MKLLYRHYLNMRRKGNCKGKIGFKVCYMEKSRILQLYCFAHYFRHFAIIIRE